ncbi:hypothetical protein [Leptolyngbya sp. PCC 6406]|uniref:hypothetical protein n=1 Tax=Leptolyngbya sp. PCC 6406 TaxID=1173264 RepID=UPI0002ACCF85|nr:hypothetical protein [Leptolyngbya sp. PCC 6406]
MSSTPAPPSLFFESFLVALETRLQAAIAPALGSVRCRVLQGRLLVLLEETTPATDEAGRQQRFGALAIAVRQSLLETELPEELPLVEGHLPVRLYLRQLGQTSPYAARNWGWKPADDLADLFDEATQAPPEDPPVASATETAPQGAIVLLPQPPLGNSEELPQASIPIPTPLQAPTPFFRFSLPPLPWRRLGVFAASGLVLGSIAYALTRPCVVGACSRRQVAYDLSTEALDQLGQEPTGAEVLGAHQQLLQAVHLLGAVPPWSPHYDRVQGDLTRYRTQLADVDWILQAQRRAMAAADQSQNPPYPVAHWVEIQLLWQRAIADLDRVPADSSVAILATAKRETYEANAATIGDRVLAEQTAENNLNQALQSAQAATTRQETAATLGAWELAQQEWQVAVNVLRRIPQGTLAHQDARPLLERYQVHLVETRTRVNREKAGDRGYRSAIAAAQAAQQAEQQSQWTRAVDYWREALDQVQQVPANTSLHGEAQVLRNTYEGALRRAQTNLRQAVALQTIETDLAAICPLGGDRCTYSTINRQIRITLLSPYDRALSQSISPPSGQGTVVPATPVVEQAHSLVQDIMQLGNRAQLPIELYDPQGGFIARYMPEYGGFMKR